MEKSGKKDWFFQQPAPLPESPKPRINYVQMARSSLKNAKKKPVDLH